MSIITDVFLSTHKDEETRFVEWIKNRPEILTMFLSVRPAEDD
jgi:hypothetical protein